MDLETCTFMKKWDMNTFQRKIEKQKDLAYKSS